MKACSRVAALRRSYLEVRYLRDDEVSGVNLLDDIIPHECRLLVKMRESLMNWAGNNAGGSERYTNGLASYCLSCDTREDHARRAISGYSTTNRLDRNSDTKYCAHGVPRSRGDVRFGQSLYLMLQRDEW